MTVSDKILYILQDTNWTQQELADKLNISQATISCWLKGKVIKEKYIEDIDNLYNQFCKTERKQNHTNETVSYAPKVLSKRGKIILKFPYY